MSDSPIFDNVDKPTPIYGKVASGPIDTPTENNHGVNHPSAKPQPKVVAATVGAGVGAAVSVILVWIIEASANIDIPETVELAVPIVIGAGLTFLAGYFKRN